MQWWALLLSAYQYSIQYVPGKQNHWQTVCLVYPICNPYEQHDSAERVHTIVMTEPLPILASQIAKLANVIIYSSTAWTLAN